MNAPLYSRAHCDKPRVRTEKVSLCVSPLGLEKLHSSSLCPQWLELIAVKCSGLLNSVHGREVHSCNTLASWATGHSADFSSLRDLMGETELLDQVL